MERMGWASVFFRKRISLGMALRPNISKSGLSVGVGPPGLNVNLNKRGRRTTIGIPGTGLFWQSFKSNSSKSNTPTNFSTSLRPGSAAPPSAGHSQFILPLGVVGGSLALTFLLFAQWHETDSKKSHSEPKRPVVSDTSDPNPTSGGAKSNTLRRHIAVGRTK
jgi:Protein of unknown function (DUF4236)